MRCPFPTQVSRGWLAAAAGLVAGIVVIDAVTPPDLVLTPLYVVPIVIASARGDDVESLGSALLCGLCAAAMDQHTGRTNVWADPVAALSQSFAWLALFSAVALGVSSWVQRHHTAARLQEALDEVAALRGMLPICAWCKRIRDDQRGGEWEPVERYLHDHAHTSFSHGICPTCAAAARAEILAERETPAA